MSTVELAQEQLLIGGRWTAAAADATFEVRSPYTGQPVVSAAAASVADADAAIDAADAAFRAWSTTAPAKRRELLNVAADLMVERTPAIAETMTEETGSTFGWGAFNVNLASGMLR